MAIDTHNNEHLTLALMISINSGLSEAPPTRKPSMSCLLASVAAVAAVTEPPYMIRNCYGARNDNSSSSNG
jgi:hypothetical protein